MHLVRERAQLTKVPIIYHDFLSLAFPRNVCVSYSGPREDVSLYGRGEVAPEGLHTDILPRPRLGDTHSPYHAMMASEVKA